MVVRPTLAESRRIDNRRYDLIPLSAELYADAVTPIEVLRILKGVSGHCFILESAEEVKRWGRYTILGFDPKLEITCLDFDDPNGRIQAVLDAHKSVKFDWLPPFTGGLVGYFAYDYAKYTEPSLKSDIKDAERFNDVDLMLFDKVIIFDHYRQKIVLIVNIDAERLETSYGEGVAQLEALRNLISGGKPAPTVPPRIKSEFRALFTQDAYCRMVERAKGYIREGDIFQVILSNRLEADFEGSLFDAYRVLRTLNPSPYMFYFSGSDLEIAGASPETLVKLEDGKLFTFPLAGTRPRGTDDAQDAAFERELLADEKELAEHNMLVDLGRNDLGKISKFGTVTVENYMSILRFSHVMHIGSTVSGEIREGKTGLDAINAVLPAGTLSGAPKIRAMQIIGELEQNRRGIYGGAIGYLDFAGNMDTCIAIRIAYQRGGKLFVRSGAGIVADSDPESEYRECLNKSMAVLRALEQSAGGLDG
ncbi:MAG: anthranilate synthase component I family protein [Firmicutes bacterium]|nr:anthranilate synthase component I family protein [Bacillota bacterium]